MFQCVVNGKCCPVDDSQELPFTFLTSNGARPEVTPYAFAYSDVQQHRRYNEVLHGKHITKEDKKNVGTDFDILYEPLPEFDDEESTTIHAISATRNTEPGHLLREVDEEWSAYAEIVKAPDFLSSTEESGGTRNSDVPSSSRSSTEDRIKDKGVRQLPDSITILNRVVDRHLHDQPVTNKWKKRLDDGDMGEDSDFLRDK